MSEFRFWFAGQRGTLLALAIFLLMFSIYVGNHPAIANGGFTVDTVGDMAQTFVVLTAGIDLSVGMVFILGNCLASYIVAGSMPMAILGVVGVVAVGAVCGAINGLI